KPSATQAEKTHDPLALIAWDLKSNDPAAQQDALARINDILANDPHEIRKGLPLWLNGLIHLKQFDTIENLAMRGLFAAPSDSYGVADMELARLKSLMAQRRYDEALPMAKAYYNVCALKDTEQAITLMAEVLANTRAKDDPNIVRKFKQQQAA